MQFRAFVLQMTFFKVLKIAALAHLQLGFVYYRFLRFQTKQHFENTYNAGCYLLLSQNSKSN